MGTVPKAAEVKTTGPHRRRRFVGVADVEIDPAGRRVVVRAEGMEELEWSRLTRGRWRRRLPLAGEVLPGLLVARGVLYYVFDIAFVQMVLFCGGEEPLTETVVKLQTRYVWGLGGGDK